MVVDAWRVSSENLVTYRIQVNEYLTKKQMEDLFQGWNQAGYGWNIKKNTKINIFQRDFPNDESWIEWVKTFPLSVVEYRRRAGVDKAIQLTNRKVAK